MSPPESSSRAIFRPCASSLSLFKLGDRVATRLSCAKKFVQSVKSFQIPRSKQTADEIAGQIVCEAAIEPAVAIECTGAASSIATAIFAVKFGGMVFATGVGNSGLEILYMRLSIREINLAFQYSVPVLQSVAQRDPVGGERIGGLEALGETHRFDVENAKQAFGAAADPSMEALKVS
jgi:L-iditol 2-dehydrogenase